MLTLKMLLISLAALFGAVIPAHQVQGAVYQQQCFATYGRHSHWECKFMKPTSNPFKASVETVAAKKLSTPPPPTTSCPTTNVYLANESGGGWAYETNDPSGRLMFDYHGVTKTTFCWDGSTGQYIQDDTDEYLAWSAALQQVDETTNGNSVATEWVKIGNSDGSITLVNRYNDYCMYGVNDNGPVTVDMTSCTVSGVEWNPVHP